MTQIDLEGQMLRRIVDTLFRLALDLIPKVGIWFVTVIPAYFGISQLKGSPTPFDPIISNAVGKLEKNKSQIENAFPGFLEYLSTMGVVTLVLAGVFAFLWWVMARLFRPSGPKEAVGFFSRVFWIAFVVYIGTIVLYYWIILDSYSFVYQVSLEMVFFIVILVFGCASFILSFWAVSPLTVIGAIPFGTKIARLRRYVSK